MNAKNSEGITVTVRDNATGEEQTRTVVNDYLLICAGSCYESGIQTYPRSGTHVVTIKGAAGVKPKDVEG